MASSASPASVPRGSPGPKILTADGQLIGHPLAITAYRNHRRPEWLSRLSLTVGLAATALTVVVAVLIGGTTGFIGGRLDLVTQRFVDAWMAFPGLLLLLTIMSIAGLADYTRALELQSAFGLLTIDSVILATALRVRADHLVTTDTGFEESTN